MQVSLYRTMLLDPRCEKISMGEEGQFKMIMLASVSLFDHFAKNKFFFEVPRIWKYMDAIYDRTCDGLLYRCNR